MIKIVAHVGTPIMAILKEGQITMACDKLGRHPVFETPLRREDLVVLDNSPANTYEATEGMGVVVGWNRQDVPTIPLAHSGNLVFIGSIDSEPMFRNVPGGAEALPITWEELLRRKYYRVAAIQWMIGVL
jgi:aconitase B